MDLEAFFEGVERCPDELVEYIYPHGERRELARLTYEYGLYDNWSMLFKIGYKEVERLLTAELGGTFKESPAKGSLVTNFSILGADVDTILVANYIRSDCLTWRGDPNVPGEHLERQQRYSSSAQIGTNGRLTDPATFRSLANVVCRIGRLCMKEGIALSFPKSVGWGNRNDFEKIVYFDP